MNISVDQGNTLTKIALFEGKTLLQTEILKDEAIEDLINRLQPKHCIISSVRKNNRINPLLIEEKIHTMVFDHTTCIPIANLYGTPETLGLDRLASVIGARQFQKEGNVLVIDCGTCITYDFINQNNEYLGGSISPGLNMRLKALNNFTSGLPLIEIEDNAELIGNSTRTAILSGVINGVICEVEGLIAKYKSLFNGLSVFLSGGDSNYFESKIRGTIFVMPELVLYGLNKILLYNVQTN